MYVISKNSAVFYYFTNDKEGFFFSILINAKKPLVFDSGFLLLAVFTLKTVFL